MIRLNKLDTLGVTQLNNKELVSFISLESYIKNDETLGVFYLKNLFDERISGMSFNLLEYDENNALINKSLVKLIDVNFPKFINKDKVNKFIHNIDKKTKRVEIEIIKIKFLTTCYKNGYFYGPSDKKVVVKEINDKDSIKEVNLKRNDILKEIIFIGSLLILITFVVIFVYIVTREILLKDFFD